MIKTHNRKVNLSSCNLSTNNYFNQISKTESIKNNKQRLVSQNIQLNKKTKYLSIKSSKQQENLKNNQKQIQILKLVRNHIKNIQPKQKYIQKMLPVQKKQQNKLFNKKIKRRSIKQVMMPQKYQDCCKIIDYIYQLIQLLSELGYPQQKISYWVYHYCEIRRPYFKNIFMKNTSRSLYTLIAQFHFQQVSAIPKSIIRYPIRKNKDTVSFIQSDQLLAFARYLQQILIQKNKLKAKQVQQSISQKLRPKLIPKIKNNYFGFTTQASSDLNNFLSDVNGYEQKFGELQSFSKINKLRLQSLNKVQKNLKTIYNDLVEGELKKIINKKNIENDIKFII